MTARDEWLAEQRRDEWSGYPTENERELPPPLTLTYEHVPRQEDVREHIRACEGTHTQQAIYSTFHDALTQVCFGCKAVRSTIKRSG